MKKLALFSSLFIALNANAAFYDRGNGMIYDSGLNITWLQDANYAVTSGYAAEHASSTTYGSNIVHADGTMGWEAAKSWAGNLVYGGLDDWRLPSARLIGNPDYSDDGSTDFGWNITRSEMGHLYNELGNIPYCLTLGYCPAVGSFNQFSFIDPNTGLSMSFQNINSLSTYWYGEEASNSVSAWYLNSWSGEQMNANKAYTGLAWAVRDGDVAAVPIPAAAWLFGSGLAGLFASARKRKIR